MTRFLPGRATTVWILLCAFTIASWRFAALHRAGALELDLATGVGIALAASAKSGLVLWQFMEVRSAPTWLRVTCLTWLVAFFAVVLALYLRAR